MNGKIILKSQEQEGQYNFNKVSQNYMTTGFQRKFGDEAQEIARAAIYQITENYPNNADYLQVLEYQKDNEQIEFWMILDDYGNGIWVLTALLPEEY